MPSFCLIVGCSNDRSKCPDLSFCRVPKIITNQGEETEVLSTERRTKSLAAISRDDLTEKILENYRVCSIHFHSGKAANLWDRYNPDWTPSLHLGHGKVKNTAVTKEEQQLRAQRISDRRKRERERIEEEAVPRKLGKWHETGERVRDIHVDIEGDAEVTEEDAENTMATTQTDFTRSCSTQTDECDYMFRSTKSWLPEQSAVFEEDYFKGDDEKVRFYTGLPSWEVL